MPSPYVFTTSETITSGDVELMVAGDVAYVAADVNLLDEAANGYVFFDAANGSAEIAGALTGYAPLLFADSSSNGVSNVGKSTLFNAPRADGLALHGALVGRATFGPIERRVGPPAELEIRRMSAAETS